MPSRADITYFGAGPALLPTDVLELAAQNLVNFENTGLGLAEHSHRSALASKIINEAKADLASYLDIPDNYDVLFMHGGGSGEFSATAYNFVGAWVARKLKDIVEGQGGKTDADADDAGPAEIKKLKAVVDEQLKIDYLVTGSWSQKAAAEAERLFGPEHVNIIADARESNNGKFGAVPDENTWKLSNDAAMVYLCDNETVDGVELPHFPKCLEPGPDGKGPIVVADMSSNILSREIRVSNYAAIFFGAQKNLGTAGLTGVIVRKDFLPQPPAALMRQLALPIPPCIFEYKTIAKNNSLYNTLSIFDVYIAGQVLKKLLRTYPNKVQGQQVVSHKKAELIYGALEAHPDVYHIVPEKTARSRMNICFRLKEGDAAEAAFLAEGVSLGLTGLKGHRSVGGIRASNYNTITVEGAENLAQFIGAFAKSRVQ